jgi:hypothetical protein
MGAAMTAIALTVPDVRSLMAFKPRADRVDDDHQADTTGDACAEENHSSSPSDM